MFLKIKKFLKFLSGFVLAVLLSGFIYNYFPNFVKVAKETGFFMASLVNSQNYRTQYEVPASLLGPVTTFSEKSAGTVILNNNFKTSVETSSLDRNDEENVSVLQNEIIEQDKLDDLVDQIDVLQRKINDLIAEKNKLQNINYKQENEDKKIEEDIVQEIEVSQEENVEVALENPQPQLSSGAKTIYPKILISEVQIAGTDNDKQEFVELYNPNEIDVSLTNWYLQRKTKNANSYSTYASNNLFAGKKILAKSYFVIARDGNFNLSAVDIWIDSPLTEDNSLVLKDPNRDISDKLGFGQAVDYESNLAESPPSGLSIGRKWEDNSERDTDNNFVDFEMQNLTPRQQNLKYIVPPDNPIISPPATDLPEKILISEVLLGGDEFIELFNPNNTDVSLTNWYLQRKTKTAENYSSYVTKNDFEGKTILANNYFLIVRQSSQYKNLADIIFDEPLTEDNSLVLKNFNGDISDKLGFGLATDFEILSAITPENDKSLVRKWLEVDNSEQDTDNNFNDFETQIPTPKSQNITFVEPPIVETPKDTTPPEVTFGLLNPIQTSLNFSINFEITDLLGTVTPSGINSFVFRWNDADPTVAENWHEDSPVEIDGHPMSIQIAKQSEAIPVVDGKTYYFQVKVKDVEGNWSEFLPQEPIFTTIELPPVIDKTPPTGTITINDGAEYTNNRNVILALFAEDDLSEVVEMKIANFSSYHDWEPYLTTKDWTLSVSGDGTKTVRVKFKDSVGNETTPGIPATIILDTINPIITLNGDVVINLNMGDVYEELGAVVNDANIDADSIIIGGDVVDISIPATYYVTYNVTDKAGNNATQITRTVVVNPIIE
ncbi:MAG: hypothetical protein A2360_02865 [Candidatus Staskawiczbacteria bacterium RIFOXYB1_FULL_32_11]|uniref:LTD domain-containing protein n=1 Tax=Candidatus Staskawiczbacteria bacterium RIFOXYD1_FULL_32_13 TaxID=1802234 RepID=A0A1G2JQF1_9BACT|nr:MAG: hypothetical protein UR22_C0012G0046 [Parcubacteria group bacterium GW2011_GWC2_32_10]OGZ79189.1 MAG: hypothetical protein A2256_03080 [Candidatus Staskawiczbacteria bacterium RIFOXYA2_FULL_32_7]OGZ79252.1 MAG: hypothetical protein A2360_02865 [Candidatus Staskawiczbacteria bacterium RIFOXYB1_FULL_32_11]OGZ85037.1 MAG: hypothetical protein A2463_04640 [Candidatus Staskawiczbacteria bacterium RIFOXYC2_FULL_32_10]OGZ89312.1 MAG: hypothetical protein A2561_02680 [Candidatus Staskawiczbacte